MQKEKDCSKKVVIRGQALAGPSFQVWKWLFACRAVLLL
jgi:hypothetical protein